MVNDEILELKKELNNALNEKLFLLKKYSACVEGFKKAICCLRRIKDCYPAQYSECVTKEDIMAMAGPVVTHGRRATDKR